LKEEEKRVAVLLHQLLHQLLHLRLRQRQHLRQYLRQHLRQHLLQRLYLFLNPEQVSQEEQVEQAVMKELFLKALMEKEHAGTIERY